MKTKKITYAGLLLAVSILLPQAFHLTGIPQAGAIFLPMHIPVLLAGFILGPLYGILIGILAPIISFFISGMPTLERLFFMVIELAIYGGISGFIFHSLGFHKKKFGSYVSLLGAMVAGRIGYGCMLLFATYLLNIPAGGLMAVVTATVTGFYGVIIQLIFIPAIVYALKKGGFLNEFIGRGKTNTI